MIGNEVLDISEQDAQHDQAHLFLRHGKVTCFFFLESGLLWNHCTESFSLNLLKNFEIRLSNLKTDGS